MSKPLAPAVSQNHVSVQARRAGLKTRLTALFALFAVVGAAGFAATGSAGSIRQFFSSISDRSAKVREGGAALQATTAASAVTTAVTAGSSLGAARQGHTATALGGGKVLIAGGDESGAQGTAEVYDVSAGSSSALVAMRAARADAAAVKLADGRVLVMGGTSGGAATASTEIYDPNTNTFSDGPVMNAARASHSAVFLSDGNVLVTGGDGGGSAEIYNAGSGAFSFAGAQMSGPRAGHSSALLNDGRVLVVGGRDAAGNELESAEIFDGASFNSTGNAMAHHRVRPLLRVLPDGKVQVIGGNDDESMEVYDPAVNIFGAHGHLIPDTDEHAALLEDDIMHAASRAALFHHGRTDALRDRDGHTITEVPELNKALVAGGANTGNTVLNNASVLNSSSATVTTDKLDYQPGQTAKVSGTGWQAGETVNIIIHEDPHTHTERRLAPQADAEGNFTATYLVEEHDLNVKFVVGAKGASSGRTAQTTFTDARNWILTFAGTGSGSVTITPSTGTINAPVSCGGTGTNAPSQTVTATCVPNISTSANGATLTFLASAGVGSTFGGWSGVVDLAPTTCSGITNPCTGVAGPSATLTVTFTSANAAPVASNVTISGTLKYGELLTGNYTYSDADGDLQGASTFRWLRNGTTVVGTNQTYTTVGADVGQTLTFEVTPVAATGVSPGTAATSPGVVIGKADQTITVTTAAPATAVHNTIFNVAATASSGLPVTITTSGVCTGGDTDGSATVTMTSGTGTCTVRYNQAGDANYNAAPEVTSETAAAKANQIITVTTPAPASAVYNTNFDVAATSDSGLAVAITTSGVCTGSGSGSATVTMTSGTGTCTVHYNQPGNDNFNAATEVTSETAAAKASQTITVTTPAPASAVYNTSFDVAATSNSGLAVAITTSGVCTGSATVTMTSGTGTCTVHYNQAGDANYNAAPEVTSNTTATKASQTITFDAPASPATYNTSFNVAPTASSGLTVSVGVSGPCSILSGSVTMTSGTGTCAITASQAGDDNYSAAADVVRNVEAAKASQTITFAAPASPAIYNTSFGVAPTASSGLTVSVATAGPCTLSSGSVTMTSGVGTCTLTASQAGDDNYSAAADVAHNVAAAKASQAITVTTPAPASATYNTTFNVAAASDSGLAVAITTSGVCSVQSGGSGSATILMTSGTGTCTVHYNQAGNDNYNAAPEVTSDTAAAKANQSITVTTAAPASAVYNTTFGVAATSTSGLAVAITTSGVCTGSGSGSATVTMTSGTGTCTVHYNQAGDSNYNAAPEVTSDTTAAKANQAITVTTAAPASAVYNTPFNVAAASDSGLAVAITTSGVCSVQSGGSGSATILMTSGTGTCTVRYNQAGDANYNAAPEVTSETAAAKANQVITVTTAAPPSAVYNTSFDVAATSDSGLAVAITSSGVCTGSGSGSATVTMTSGTGTCTVHYNQPGNDNFNAATEVTSETAAAKASQTITVTTPAPASATYNTTFDVAAASDSGLPVTVTTSGVCSGGDTDGSATILMTSGTGTCTVHYNQAGNDNFNAATEVSSETAAAKANQIITVTTPAPASAVYNTSFGVAATSDSGLAVAITTSGVCSVQSGGSGSATILMTSGTGTCTVRYNQAGDSNYNAASESTSNTSAIKVTLNVTANNASKVYDGVAYSGGNGVTYSGFVTGENEAALGGTLTFGGTSQGALTVGTYTIIPGGLTSSNYAFTYNNGTLTITTGYCFIGFHSPIGGSVETGNGGNFADPVRAFKLGSTIPVKFTIKSWNGSACGSAVTTGIHTLQATKYSNATDPTDVAIAVATDSATIGNQFRLTDSDWHFNLSTKGGFSVGTWLLKATLQDGSIHTVWVSIKK